MIEIQITELDGTLKMGQNGSKADRESAAQALSKIGSDDALATAYLARNCERQQVMDELQKEVERVAKVRGREAEKNSQMAPLKWWDICVGAVLIGVPVFAYRFLINKRL